MRPGIIPLVSFSHYYLQIMSGKTLRLVYPQFQGGWPQSIADCLNNQFSIEDATFGYWLGSQIMNIIAPKVDGPTCEVPINTDQSAEALKDDAQILNPVEKDFLKNLPIQLELTEGGVKFLLVHGSPRRNNEDILPDTPVEEVENMLENVDADVILCGHTHIPCGFQTTKKQTVVNAGSIGRPFTPEPKACYLTITVENKQCVFEHHFVEYDKERASEKLSKREFKGADKLAGMLIDPKTRHF